MQKSSGTDDAGKDTLDVALLEVANRDLWQLDLVSRDDRVCGRVIRQLVEPSMCTIRYLIVYDKISEHHVPVPADTILEITEKAVFCDIDAAGFSLLPTLSCPFDRTKEEQVHAILSQTPYWVEEAELGTDSQNTDEN
jgi:hypothetical protein